MNIYLEIIEWIATGLLIASQYLITSSILLPNSLTFKVLVSIAAGVIGLTAYIKKHGQVVFIETGFIIMTWLPDIQSILA